MLNRADIFALALEQKRQKVQLRERRFEEIKNAAYRQNPRLSEIDREIAQKGASVVTTALSGDTAALAALQATLTALQEERQSLLAQAGVAQEPFDCALCHDTGYVQGKICDCIKNEARRLTAQQMSAEMPLNECRFENFNLNYYADKPDENGVSPRKRMTAIFKLCKEFALNFQPNNGKNLLFMGNAGLGKTHLTLAIVSAVIDKGYEVIYGSAQNLLNLVEREQFSAEKGDSFETMTRCDLLVIDDLGTEFTSPFALTTLYGLINTRLLANRSTILNTNLSMAEIEARYTPRISSRLIGNYTAKKFFGKDIRQLKAMEKINRD
ncbi:MAG: ATP-binding protein [Clostridia bacterium]|nr:ATP-binding protein [Clostridia bacterium]